MNDLEEYERDCLQRESEMLREEAEEEYRKELPKALFDKIIDLSHVQGKLKFINDHKSREGGYGEDNADLIEQKERLIEECLEKVTQVRRFMQNNYQQLKTY